MFRDIYFKPVKQNIIGEGISLMIVTNDLCKYLHNLITNPSVRSAYGFEINTYVWLQNVYVAVRIYKELKNKDFLVLGIVIQVKYRCLETKLLWHYLEKGTYKSFIKKSIGLVSQYEKISYTGAERKQE